jgi:hypothetical protein
MPGKPMIGQEDRPDLTVNTEGTAGSSPRNLETILGSSATKTVETKQVVEKQILKDTNKDTIKDSKDTKDHKDPKEHKDQKDTKDHKDPKDQKDQKDQKDPKEHKDQKDTKEHKDPKEHKDQKDVKDHKEGIKEHIKEVVKEAIKENIVDTIPQSPVIPDPAPDDLTDLISRVSRLEKAVADLKK